MDWQIIGAIGTIICALLALFALFKKSSRIKKSQKVTLKDSDHNNINMS